MNRIDLSIHAIQQAKKLFQVDIEGGKGIIQLLGPHYPEGYKLQIYYCGRDEKQTGAYYDLFICSRNGSRTERTIAKRENVFGPEMYVFIHYLNEMMDELDQHWTPEDLERSWKELGNIPINPETECIEEPFMRFSIGTPREDIWHFFDEHYPFGIHSLMFPTKNQEEPENPRRTLYIDRDLAEFLEQPLSEEHPEEKYPIGECKTYLLESIDFGNDHVAEVLIHTNGDRNFPQAWTEISVKVGVYEVFKADDVAEHTLGEWYLKDDENHPLILEICKMPITKEYVLRKAIKLLYDALIREFDKTYFENFCVKLPLDTPYPKNCVLTIWGAQASDGDRYFSLYINNVKNGDCNPILDVQSESCSEEDLGSAISRILDKLIEKQMKEAL